jgi:elongation factor P
MPAMKATDLRKGLGAKIDGRLYFLTAVEHRTPGNLRAFVQISAKDVLKGNTIERRLGSGDDLDVVDLDNREMEYLYSDSTGATFMDGETFDQVVMPKEVLGDGLLYLIPNTKCNVLMYDGNPVTLDLPGSVVLKIVDCPPEVKGATVTNQMKDAELETGLKTRVPGFIKVGEMIRVNTADGSYQSRA